MEQDILVKLVEATAWPFFAFTTLMIFKDKLKRLMLKSGGNELNLLLDEVSKKNKALEDKVNSILTDESYFIEYSEEKAKQVKASLNEVKSIVQQQTKSEVKLHSEPVEEITSGSNANGSYEIHSNGLIVQTIKVDMYCVLHRQSQPFPIQFSDKVIGATIIGHNVSIIEDLTTHSIQFSQEGMSSSGEAEVIITGM